MYSAPCCFALKHFPEKDLGRVVTEGVCVIRYVSRQRLNLFSVTTDSNRSFLICHMLNKMGILVICNFCPRVPWC